MLLIQVLFGEVDTMPSPAASVAPLVGDEKGGLPIEAFARVQELFNSGTWDDGHGDAALRFLQQQFANGFQERSEKSPLGDVNTGKPVSSRGSSAQLDEDPRPDPAQCSSLRGPTPLSTGPAPQQPCSSLHLSCERRGREQIFSS